MYIKILLWWTFCCYPLSLKTDVCLCPGGEAYSFHFIDVAVDMSRTVDAVPSWVFYFNCLNEWLLNALQKEEGTLLTFLLAMFSRITLGVLVSRIQRFSTAFDHKLDHKLVYHRVQVFGFLSFLLKWGSSYRHNWSFKILFNSIPSLRMSRNVKCSSS